MAKITGDLDVLLTFYDFPAEHHKHLRTTNVIESTFATVRLRQRTTKGPGCRDAGVAMAYKLLDAAQTRWRRLNGPELVALVRAGATFIDGRLQNGAPPTPTPPDPEGRRPPPSTRIDNSSGVVTSGYSLCLRTRRSVTLNPATEVERLRPGSRDRHLRRARRFAHSRRRVRDAVRCASGGCVTGRRPADHRAPTGVQRPADVR